MSISIAALASNAIRRVLTAREIAAVFQAYPKVAAPKFSDPAPEDPRPFAHRMAADLFRDYFETATVSVWNNFEDGEHTIDIEVLENGAVLFRYIVVYSEDGNMKMLIARGPIINIAATYKDGLLTETMIFTASKHQRIRFEAGSAISTCVLTLSSAGRIIGNMLISNPFQTRMITANTLAVFEPQIQFINSFADALEPVK